MLRTLTLLILTAIVMASIACGPSAEELRIDCKNYKHWRDRSIEHRDTSATKIAPYPKHVDHVDIEDHRKYGDAYEYHATRVVEWQTKIDEIGKYCVKD